MTRLDVGAHAPMVVFRATGTISGRLLAWASLTMQSPDQAFANVCIEDGVAPRDQWLFVDAVVAAVCRLGARQVLLVLPRRELMLLEHVHAHCDVLTVAPVGQTVLIRADLAGRAREVSTVVVGTSPGGLEIRIEPLWSEEADTADDVMVLG